MNFAHVLNAVAEELATRIVRHDDHERRYSLRDNGGRPGWMEVGFVILRGPIPPDGVQYIPDGDCRAGYAKLAARFPEIDGAYVVLESRLVDSLRGKGHGRALYEKALLDAGVRERRVLMPDRCLADDDPNGALHETSRAAERVWESLKREYPHEGDVVYGG